MRFIQSIVPRLGRLNPVLRFGLSGRHMRRVGIGRTLRRVICFFFWTGRVQVDGRFTLRLCAIRTCWNEERSTAFPLRFEATGKKLPMVQIIVYRPFAADGVKVEVWFV